MSLGVLLDYAYWRTDGAPLRDLGVVGVIRYLSDDPANPKNAQVPEIKALHGHRIGVVPIYEQRSTDALGGAPRGTAAGKAAVRMLRAEGWPPGTVCAVAVDTDVTTATMEKSVAFVEAFEAVLAGQAYDTGVYGEADLIDALFARGIASHLYIQTEAWSGGRLSEHADLVQVIGHRLDTSVIGGPSATDEDWPTGRRAVPMWLPDTPTADAVIAEAMKSVGYHEVGVNETTFAGELDAVFGPGGPGEGVPSGAFWRQGSAWCATFSAYAYWRASGSPLVWPLPIDGFGTVSDLRHWQAAGKSPEVGQRGDFIYYAGSNFPEGHTGIVTAGPYPDGTYDTIEGNDADGVRVHDGVQNPRRTAADIIGFGRPTYANDTTPTEDPMTFYKHPDDGAVFVTDGVTIKHVIPEEATKLGLFREDGTIDTSKVIECSTDVIYNHQLVGDPGSDFYDRRRFIAAPVANTDVNLLAHLVDEALKAHPVIIDSGTLQSAIAAVVNTDTIAARILHGMVQGLAKAGV